MYATATAFRQALEGRLRRLGLESNTSLSRLRKVVAFDRLLARMVAADPGLWIVKGGYALEMRLGARARTTRDVFRHFAELMRERVEPVHAVDVEQAALLADTYPDLGAQDLLHAAVMSRLGVRSIVSADAGFDRLPEVERLDPTDVGVWRDKLAL